MPYTAPASMFVFNASGTLSTQATRIYGQDASIKMKDITVNSITDTALGKRILHPKDKETLAEDAKEAAEARYDSLSCEETVKAKYGLSGQLGIKEIADIGFQSLKNTKGDIISPNAAGGGNPYGAFGQSMQFILTRNVSAVGPTWIVTHFKGPGVSGGLFAAGRVETNKVIVAFEPPAETPAAAAAGVPGTAARSLVNSLAIQTILSTSGRPTQ